jgi:predicted Fe-Mo cluster-binding NifX family protein
MKIAVAVDEKSLDSLTCQSFGRAAYFLLYDSQNKQSVFIDNTAAQSQGGAGIKAAQTVADSGAEALVTFRLGENAARVLNAAGIKIYCARDGRALDNAVACADGQLEILSEVSPGLHRHG